MSDYRLTAAELSYDCNLEQFKFATTAELKGEFDLGGQQRAITAIDFGLQIKEPGYNIYTLNFEAEEEIKYILRTVKEIAAQEERASDLCYVHNFSNPEQPIALEFNAGLGIEFKSKLENKIKTIKEEINKLLSSEQYNNQKRKIKKKYQTKTQKIFTAVKAEVKEMGYLLIKEENGFSITPLLENGSPMSEEKYNSLPLEEQEQIDVQVAEINNKIDQIFNCLDSIEEKFEAAITKLNNNLAAKLVKKQLEELYVSFADNAKVINYLSDLETDILANIDKFKEKEEQEIFLVPKEKTDDFYKYKVNLVVNNKNFKGSPVIKEDNPTYYNLMGRVEYKNLQNGLDTNFTQIKTGSLQQANGGYLILEAARLVTNFKAWQLLKQVLKTGQIQMENLGMEYEQIPLATLMPEAVAMNLKVILVGSAQLYYLLQHYDPEFKELFKIKADFSIEVQRTKLNTYKLIQYISYKCKEEGLLELNCSAVEEVIKYCSRKAGNQNKLEIKYSQISSLLKEADVIAKQKQNDLITNQDIKEVQAKKKYWYGKYESKLEQSYLEDKILIDVTGFKIGVVNGLSIIDLGDYTFGRPTKITAVVYKGEEGVVNIEREINISGKIHNKGVMTLESYLGNHFAQEVNLNLSARICFEQLYTGIDGDSASSAELYALLSALSKVPIRQDIAVTGSINQNGKIQPVGGVIEKIEGFFNFCKMKGLTGSQGVIIPEQNKKDLILAPEIIEAVKDEQFNIYTITNVSEGLKILIRQEQEDINNLVQQRINNWAKKKLESN
ncbi:MAG: Lon protease family protein [Bacillota bacterium]